jgi:DNA-binding NarL/FixJ family response regulator
MPLLSGAQAAARLLAAQPDLAILILTKHQDDESLFAAMRAGARGYLLKGADSTEVTAAIQAVAQGRSCVRSRRRATQRVGHMQNVRWRRWGAPAQTGAQGNEPRVIAQANTGLSLAYVMAGGELESGWRPARRRCG